MPVTIPSADELMRLCGTDLYEIWLKLVALVDKNYDMEKSWHSGGKAWKYEYKYRRGGKTLCSLFVRENRVGFMVIFGKDERAKFEADRDDYSTEIQVVYDKAQTYHDGKWMMFEPKTTDQFDDFMKLLYIKRKPNRK